MDEMRRRLSGFEANFAKTAAGLVNCRFTARGVLHKDAMLRAFAALREEHPELAGGLEPVEGGYDLVASRSEQRPVEKFVRIVEADPDGRFPHELDISETLSGLDMVSQGDRHLVVLWVSHCVADGFRAVYLGVRLGYLYMQLVEHGSLGELVLHPLPKSPEQLLFERGMEKSEAASVFDRVAGVRWSGRMPKADELPEGDLQPVRRQTSLDPDTAAKLRAAAKRRACTMHGIVAGAIAVAERSNFTDVPGDEQVPMGVASVIEMRGRVSPPVSPAEVTIFANWSLKRFDLTNDSDPVAVGRSVAEQLREDLDSGALLQGLFHPPPESHLVPVIAINNLGSLPKLPLPPETVMEDPDPIFDVDLNPLRAVVEALPEDAELPAPAGPFYLIYSYDDVLHIDVWNIPGSLPAEAQDRVLARAVELLTGIAESTD